MLRDLLGRIGCELRGLFVSAGMAKYRPLKFVPGVDPWFAAHGVRAPKVRSRRPSAAILSYPGPRKAD